MKQSRIDSLMEAFTNVFIGTIIYTVVNYFVLSWMLGIPISPSMSLTISALFTVISITRSYVIRRAFNGQTVWQALKAVWGGIFFRCDCMVCIRNRADNR